jgi:hypothetical protein
MIENKTPQSSPFPLPPQNNSYNPPMKIARFIAQKMHNLSHVKKYILH